MRAANLALSFLLELTALAAFAIWGAGAEPGALGVAHAIIAPLIVALLWGRFAAPRPRHRLPAPTRIPFELTVFALGVVALAISGHLVWAAIDVVLILINAAGRSAFDQWEM